MCLCEDRLGPSWLIRGEQNEVSKGVAREVGLGVIMRGL